MSFYVEFIGVSGAGKTTLIKEGRELFIRRGWKCVTKESFFPKYNNKWYKLFWSLTHLQYLDLKTMKWLLLLGRSQKMGFKRVSASIYEHIKLWYQLAHLRTDEVVLWDSIFIQRFIHLISDSLKNKEEVLSFMLDKLPDKTILVLVDTPVEEAARRRHKREVFLRAVANKSMSEKNAEEKRREYEYLNQTKQDQIRIVKELEQRGISICRVDGLLQPKENASIVYGYIKNNQL